MRRIKLILAVAASMAVLMVLSAAPAMAVDVDLDGNDDGECVLFDDGSVICDGDFDGFVAGPAGLEFEQEDVQSGDVTPVVDIVNTGDNANLAPTVLQSANSGNVQNQQGVTQFNSASDDIEFEGSSIDIDSSVDSDATQTIRR